MKFKVHTDFRGSQDGIVATEFKAGSVVEISDHLAPHIRAWANPVGAEFVVEADAIESPNAAPSDAAVVSDGAEPPKRRGRPPKAH